MKVSVGASSANLGPGFDCFGLAWQLYNTMEFMPADRLVIEGCDEKYKNAENLAYRAYTAALAAAGKAASGVCIRFLRTDIPVSRGLGSSAALTVGGVLAADRLNGLGFSDEQLLAVATSVEGHPDNVAPALFGGLTVSAMDGGKAVSAVYALSDRLHFTALVPDSELSTSMSRSVLPQSISREDAIFNVSRAALLLKALENGDCGLIRTALRDRIHQPFRKALIEGYDRAEALALETGAAGVCISGAGSTILCVSPEEDFYGKMKAAAEREFPRWRVLDMKPDTLGARITE